MRARPVAARPAGIAAIGRGAGGPVRSGRWLVAVVVGLVGALDGHADVGGLLRAQLGQLRAERVEVQAGDLLVEVLGST